MSLPVVCSACRRYLGSSSDRGAASRMLTWHRSHCEAALDLDVNRPILMPDSCPQRGWMGATDRPDGSEETR